MHSHGMVGKRQKSSNSFSSPSLPSRFAEMTRITPASRAASGWRKKLPRSRLPHKSPLSDRGADGSARGSSPRRAGDRPGPVCRRETGISSCSTEWLRRDWFDQTATSHEFHRSDAGIRPIGRPPGFRSMWHPCEEVPALRQQLGSPRKPPPWHRNPIVDSECIRPQ